MFSNTEIQQFVEQGYVIHRGGFSSEIAAQGQDFIWEKLGLASDAPETWTQTVVHIPEVFYSAPFDAVLNSSVKQAADQLTAEDRAELHGFWGWWPLLFPGFEGPGGWHVDGYFQHQLTSQEQGLVTLYLFSDIEPGDGSTALVPGSHLDIARILNAAEPAGSSLDDLMAKLPDIDPEQSVEVTGKAGDIAFLHPFLIHGFGANRGNKVRFACNPQYALKELMNLNRPDENYSPVEAAIRFALHGS